MPEEDEESQSTAQRNLQIAAQLLSLAYAVMVILAYLWMLIPEHRKRLIAMKASRTIALSAWRTAFRAGHREMALELKGCGTSYQVPYRLCQVALKAERAYEKLRYTA